MTCLGRAAACAMVLMAASAAAQDVEVRCEVFAEVADRDPKGLNVRAGPGSQHAVIANLPTTHGIVVEVSAARGQWMRVKSTADGNGERDFSKREAWVFGPLLAFDAWSRQRVRTIPARAEPDSKSVVVAQLPVGKGVALAGCRGTWARVRHGGKDAWVAAEHRCANPFTECN